ncbi:hypothetical protein ACFV0H_07565 [Streptomyces erythrochromogenes]|uniref:hypothetical protein n=1 Tax=Streptomyces erythrochromogenes TaxID=285574 RepID=UPI00368CEC68
MNPTSRITGLAAAVTPWRIALTTVSLAALLTTGWSLYAVGRHYDAPTVVAAAAVAVFDGIAYACQHLASEASKEGRSAVGARLATLAMAGTSVYLNDFHADLINGGPAASVLFSVPTLALLAVSELAWAGPRAAARASRGEQPYRPPAFGGWAWLLAPTKAGQAVKSRALDHIETAGRAPTPPPKDRTATAVLREKFAEMDPGDAVRIAHDAQPDMPPAELAALLVTYGVIVDAVQVALILGRTPASITLERDDAPDTQPDAPHVTSPLAIDKAQAIRDAAAALGAKPKAAEIVDHVQRVNRITVEEPYVRTVLSRARRKPKPQGDTERTGFYP